MARISVIVPVYGVEKYLCRCIDSILNQTFIDFELILVDDGSPDKCPEICDEYAAKDNRVVVIHQKNGGLSAARNAGIDWVFNYSNSEWMSFIDSDDWVHPFFLEYLYRAAIENSVSISICDVERVNVEWIEFKKMDFKTEKKDAIEFYMENTVWATVAWNKLFARKVFEGYRYLVGKLHEDEFLIYKLLYNVKNIAWIDVPLYEYYIRNDSIMGQFSLNRLDILEALQEQADFFKDKDVVIHKKKLIQLLYTYRSVMQQMEERSEMQLDCKRVYKEFLRKFRKYRKYLNLSIEKQSWLFETAYPKRMRFYWIIKNIIEKFDIN